MIFSVFPVKVFDQIAMRTRHYGTRISEQFICLPDEQCLYLVAQPSINRATAVCYTDVHVNLSTNPEMN